MIQSALTTPSHSTAIGAVSRFPLVEVTRATFREVSYIALDKTFSGTLPPWLFLRGVLARDRAQEAEALTDTYPDQTSMAQSGVGFWRCGYFFQLSGMRRLAGSFVVLSPKASSICT